PSQGLSYIISIPVTEEANVTTEDAKAIAEAIDYEANFEYLLEGVSPTDGIAVLTGPAAVQQISLSYVEAGWDVTSPNAASVEATGDAHSTQAQVLLGPGRASLFLKPKSRDISTEETQF